MTTFLSQNIGQISNILRDLQSGKTKAKHSRWSNYYKILAASNWHCSFAVYCSLLWFTQSLRFPCVWSHYSLLLFSICNGIKAFRFASILLFVRTFGNFGLTNPTSFSLFISSSSCLVVSIRQTKITGWNVCVWKFLFYYLHLLLRPFLLLVKSSSWACFISFWFSCSSAVYRLVFTIGKTLNPSISWWVKDIQWKRQWVIFAIAYWWLWVFWEELILFSKDST